MAVACARVDWGLVVERLTRGFDVVPWRGRFGGVGLDPGAPSFGVSVTVGKPSRRRGIEPQAPDPVYLPPEDARHSGGADSVPRWRVLTISTTGGSPPMASASCGIVASQSR